MSVQTRGKALSLRTVEKCESIIMDHSIWGNLQPEIIEHILSFLPVKHLCRFKCISTSWNSIISSPNFAKTHRHITNNTPNRPQKTLLITCSLHLCSVDFVAMNPTAERLAFFGLSDPNQVRVWGSCNGLVLISANGTFYNLYLLNPFTRECKKLPDCPLFDCCPYNIDYDVVANGFGYDSSMNDYKVVMLHFPDLPNASKVAVYSLKTDAWRRIQDICYDFDLEEYNRRGCFFNERLHWWFWDCTDGSIGLVSFDLSDEIFRKVDLPTSFSSCYNIDGGVEYLYSLVPGSCLCLVVSPYSLVVSPYSNASEIDVWMMTKYGVRESWTKVTIPNHGMLGEDIFKIPTHGMAVEDVLFFAAKEEFLLRMIEKVNGVAVQPGRKKLIVYNQKNNTVRDMVVCSFPEYTLGGNYFETLVSPDHGRQIWRTYEPTLG